MPSDTQHGLNSPMPPKPLPSPSLILSTSFSLLFFIIVCVCACAHAQVRVVFANTTTVHRAWPRALSPPPLGSARTCWANEHRLSTAAAAAASRLSNRFIDGTRDARLSPGGVARFPTEICRCAGRHVVVTTTRRWAAALYVIIFKQRAGDHKIRRSKWRRDVWWWCGRWGGGGLVVVGWRWEEAFWHVCCRSCCQKNNYFFSFVLSACWNSNVRSCLTSASDFWVKLKFTFFRILHKRLASSPESCESFTSVDKTRCLLCKLGFASNATRVLTPSIEAKVSCKIIFDQTTNYVGES